VTPQLNQEKPTVRVLAVTYADVEGHGTVRVSLEGPGKPTWKSFLLKDPARLVVDIEGAVLPSRPEPLQVGDGIVDKVRVAQFSSNVVRLVIDLCQESAHSVTSPEENPHEIVITFPQRVTGLEFREVDGRAEAIVKGTGKLKYKTSILIDPPRIVVDLPGAVLVGNPGPMPVSHGIARQIRASQHSPDTVRVVVDLAKETTYSVFTSSDRPGEVVVDFGHRILGAAFATHLKSTRVTVKSTGLPPAKITRLVEPHRLVMDFEDSVLDAPEGSVEVGDGTIERIRLAQFGPMTVRVVVDLPYYVGHYEPPRELGPDGSWGETAVEITRSPLYKKTIVVDPGHGGSDPGAVGATGLQEKAVTLDISKRVAAMLSEAGAKAVLTRTDDVSVFLPERVKVAAEERADIFISVHANAGRTETSSGTETLFCSSVPMSRRLAEHVQTSLVRAIGLPDRGVRERPDLYVIREAKMPSCLVEVVFMSNLTEELLLMDPGFRDRAARGITKGIWSYFEWRMEAGAEEARAQPGATRETAAETGAGAGAGAGTSVSPANGEKDAAGRESGSGNESGNAPQTRAGAPEEPAPHAEPNP
jgi:N-acetylmuramoyl-L-alanine amidase